MPDTVWVGDLSGFRLEVWDDGRAMLGHRCGWAVPADRTGFLANLVEQAQRHRADGCDAGADSPADDAVLVHAAWMVGWRLGMSVGVVISLVVASLLAVVA
jgi:hypothetical protein